MEPDQEKTLKATEELQQTLPDLVCPFCRSEKSFIRQVRTDGCEHAFAIYDPESSEITSTYPVTMITCYECGFCMPFITHVLDTHLEEAKQASLKKLKEE